LLIVNCLLKFIEELGEISPGSFYLNAIIFNKKVKLANYGRLFLFLINFI